MSAEIDSDTTSALSTVSAIVPAETIYDWSNTVTWIISPHYSHLRFRLMIEVMIRVFWIVKFTYVQHRNRESMSISLVVLRFEVADDLPFPQGLDYCGLYN